MKKTRRDCSRRVPTVELAGPGLRAPQCQAHRKLRESLAGDPSEVTALGKRHWITSFRCVDGSLNIGTESSDVKGSRRRCPAGTKAVLPPTGAWRLRLPAWRDS